MWLRSETALTRAQAGPHDILGELGRGGIATVFAADALSVNPSRAACPRETMGRCGRNDCRSTRYLRAR
jgi:hypothetical protein